MPFSLLNLTTLISKKKWVEVLERIVSHPDEVRVCKDGILPIHRACGCDDVPFRVIEALIETYPQSLEQKCNTFDGGLPIHDAVSHDYSTINTDVIKLLLQHYKGSASVKDEDGCTPLQSHLYCSPSPSLEVVKMLVEAHPDAVRTHDQYKWYPLHCAAACDNWQIAIYLIDLYPEALVKHTFTDQIPRIVADEYRKFKMCDKLREEEETRFGRTIGNQSHQKEEYGHTEQDTHS